MNYKSFCGGIFETNCYLFEAPEGWILFDAPEGACEWARSLKVEPKLLLLTHGHIDHVQDVARIKRQFGCSIGCHPLTAPIISDRRRRDGAFRPRATNNNWNRTEDQSVCQHKIAPAICRGRTQRVVGRSDSRGKTRMAQDHRSLRPCPVASGRPLECIPGNSCFL